MPDATKSPRRTVYIVIACLCAVIVLIVIVTDVRSASEGRRRDELAAIAASVSAQQAAWNTEHPGAGRWASETAQQKEARLAREATEKEATWPARSSDAAAAIKAAQAKRLQTKYEEADVKLNEAQLELDGFKTTKIVLAPDFISLSNQVTSERLAMKPQLDAIRAKQAKLADVQDRKDFASAYDTELLARRMNPEGVSAIGAESRTLHVTTFLCTRQFVYDEGTGNAAERLRAHGFKRLECSNDFASYWQDL